MSFELTFLGSSGGPIESGTCSVLIKPAEITYQEIIELQESPVIAIDAGSGLLSLAHIIADADKVMSQHVLLYSDSLALHRYSALRQTNPFSLLRQSTLSGAMAALKLILGKVRNIFITHPHLDHVSALVLNLPAYANLFPFVPSIHGSDFTVSALRTHIFNGVVWPDLELSGVVSFRSMNTRAAVLTGEFCVTMLDLCHGHRRDGSVYPSLVYVVRNTRTGAHIAIFGDFESDLVLGTRKNSVVWEELGKLMELGLLKAIVVECLTATPKVEVDLYGHLIPPHLVAELQVLASFCPSKPSLEGLDVIITHVKDVTETNDPRLQIKLELEQLRRERNLAFRLSMALNGMLVLV